MSWPEVVYHHSPVWAQHLAVTAYGSYWYWLRRAGGFRDQVREYRARDAWPREVWDEFQGKRLRSILCLAATAVPYYRQTWSAAELRAAREGRLSGLPLLEKTPLREVPRAFCRDDRRTPFPRVFHTSGSTGTPIATYWTIEECRRAVALREARSASWAGVSFGMPRATFSGRLVVSGDAMRGPFHRYNAIERQVYFSAFHLAPQNVAEYVEALRAHGTEWMTGYAGSIGLLASLCREARVPAPLMRAVVTTSERLEASMRDAIQEVFGCRTWEEYSTVENALFASECEAGSLHVSPDAGIVEIIRADGSPCAPGEIGEVVATCLSREYQPLIRFRLGDLASWSEKPCPCGRSMPILSQVVGRVEDAVVTPDGRRTVRFHGLFVGLPGVIEGQVVQDAVDRIRVLVVVGGAFSDRDAETIRQRVVARLGQGVSATVEPVAHLQRAASGKLKAVVSRLNERHS